MAALAHDSGWVSKLLPIALLRSTVAVNGKRALEHEALAIARLRERGVRVPLLIAQTEGWIVLSDMGLTLEKQVYAAASRCESWPLIEAGLLALARLHQAGGWHGNPQIRNLAGPPERMGFIDFEEDVGRRLGAVNCQTRDWFLFLLSLGRVEQRWPGTMQDAVVLIREQSGAPVRKALFRIRFFTTPAMWVCAPFARWLGRDVRYALAVWRALSKIAPATLRRWRWWMRIGIGVLVLFWCWSSRFA